MNTILSHVIAFLLGLGSGVVGTVLVWRKNKNVITQDVAAVQGVVDAAKKL